MSEEPSEYGGPTRESPILEEHLKSRSTWLRLLYMIVLCVFLEVARLVGAVVVVVQFVHVLFTGQTNSKVLELGQSLATYVYQIVEYLTFNSERRPFPFDEDWPKGTP